MPDPQDDSQQFDLSGGVINSAPPQQSGQDQQFDLSSGIVAPQDGNQSFTTPGGRSYQVGQKVQHSSGATGTVTGQHPDSGNAVVDWAKHVFGMNNGPGNFLSDMGQGEVSRAASGLAGIDKRVSKIPGVGKFLTTPLVGGKTSDQAQADLQNVANQQPDNLAGSTGSGLSQVVGFIMGQEGLAGIGYSDQLLKASGLSKALESSPTLLKLATIGHNAIKAGGIAGLQNLVGGGSVGEAAYTGAKVGGASAGLESIPLALQVPSVIGKGLSALDSATSKAFPKIYPPDAEYTTPTRVTPAQEPIPDVPAKTTVKANPQSVSEQDQLIHDRMHAQLRNHIVDEAEKSGIPVGSNIRNADGVDGALTEFSKATMNQAKSLYSSIDDAVERATGFPGKFQKLDENIHNLETQLREGIGDPEKQQTIQDKLNDAYASRSDIMSTVVGTDLEDAPEEATRLFKQAKALDELKVKAARNTSGLPMNLDPEGASPQKLNPKTFGRSLKVLDTTQKFGGNRLRQALPNNADDVIKSVDNARSNLDQLKTSTKQGVALANDQASRVTQEAQQVADAAKARNQAAKSAADEANARAKDLSDVRTKQVEQIKAKRRAAQIIAGSGLTALGGGGLVDLIHRAHQVSTLGQ